MPVYDYSALATDGRREKGLLTADHAIDLGQQLGALGLTLLRAREISPLMRRVRIEPNLSNRERAQIFTALARIVESGSPWLESLMALAQSQRNATARTALLDVARQVARGRPLSLAMGQHRKVFAVVPVALVAAGERAGRLDVAFRQCEAHVNWVDQTGRRVVQALSYPLLLVGLSVAVLSFMVTWLAPRVLEYLASLRQMPGPMTLSLMKTSEFARLHWSGVLTAVLVVLAVLWLMHRAIPPVGRAIDRALLRLPLLGTLLRCGEASRFAHFMALGLASGLTAQRALDVAATLLRNRALRAAMLAAADRIAEGHALAPALEATRLFDPMAAHALRSAAMTDNLAEAFRTISQHAEQDAQQLGSRVVALVPPVLIVLVGGVLAWILAALFFPVYSTIGLEALM